MQKLIPNFEVKEIKKLQLLEQAVGHDRWLLHERETKEHISLSERHGHLARETQMTDIATNCRGFEEKRNGKSKRPLYKLFP